MYHRQLLMTITEEQRKPVRFGTVGLEQIAVGQRFRESPEHRIVWEEMRVGHLSDRIDVKGIFPECIRTDVGLTIRIDNIMVEGDHLALLVKHIIAVGILEGVHTVRPRSDTSDDEMSPAVGMRNA